jgi:hypothetical protein
MNMMKVEVKRERKSGDEKNVYGSAVQRRSQSDTMNAKDIK